MDSLATTVGKLLLEILSRALRRDVPLREQGLDSMTTTRLWLELRARLGGDPPLPWSQLHAARPSPVALPSYPFDRRRHSVPPVPPVSPLPARRELDVPLYRKAWKRAGGGSTAPMAGQLLCVFHDGSEPVVRELARQLGSRVTLVRGGSSAHDARTAAGWAEAWIDLCDLYRVYRPDRLDEDRRALRARAGMLQRFLGAGRGAARRVLHVTNGLQDLDGVPSSLAGARVAGLVRMLHAEQRQVIATTLDIDVPATSPAEAARLIVEELDRGAPEVCYRAGLRYVPELRAASVPEVALRLDPDRVYVVTGGTRGLGALVARRLIERGARRLALMGGPRPPGSGADPAAPFMRDLEAIGARVLVYRGPLTARAEVDGFLASARRLGDIGGIVHCAGRMLDDRRPFFQRDPAGWHAVYDPKVDGLEVLAELCAHDRPAFFVLFSSVAGSFPALGAGAAEHAAASAFLDWFAAHQARTGKPWFRSVAWPSWRDAGASAPVPPAYAQLGLDGINVEQGLRVLEAVAALPSGGTLLAVPGHGAQTEPSALLEVPREVPPDVFGDVPLDVFSDVLREAPRDMFYDVFGDVPRDVLRDVPCDMIRDALRDVPREVPCDVLRDVPSSPPLDRTNAVLAWLTALFAESLGTSPAALLPDLPFGDLGIDSLLLVQLLPKIEAVMGRPLGPAIWLEHPTLASLAAALLAREVRVTPAACRSDQPTGRHVGPLNGHRRDRLNGHRSDRPNGRSNGRPAARPNHRQHDHQIAVVGMSCRFPGAPDLASFWTNLRQGRCAIDEVPPSRWEPELLYRPEHNPGKTISKWGGFVDGIEAFDPAYFQMTDEEATCLDPSVRLVLEGVETCLADAGYTGRELAGRDVGVFAGARVSDYGRRTGARAGSAWFGADHNFIATRVAQHLDLGGPCFVVDSACSSSLVAIQLAVRSLLAGESELAFAAGVEVLLDERPYLEFSAARALSPSGRCRVFDERADGFVPGEGCGVLLLKRLDRALCDGDRIHAIIASVAVNNDGRTAGLTTPSPAAQTKVILRALEHSGLGADDVAMIEAHGAGTMLADPIELRALTDAFARTSRTGRCAVGSVKSNIGHLFSAAGIAGLIKAMLALEHGEIPPTLFCDRPNPRFDFGRSPFYPNVTARPWPDDRPIRAAGVSAFGLGGTNAHLIATALDPHARAAARVAAVRRPLPSPVFQRRHLWLGRETIAAPRPAARPALVSPILDLEFVANR